MASAPFTLPSPAVQAMAQRNPSVDEYDVLITCEDGTVWHAFYRGKAQAPGWQGCEKVAGP